MKQIAEAIIDENGQIHLMEPLHVTGLHRALVTVLDEPPARWDETLMVAERPWRKIGCARRRTKRGRTYSRRGRPDSVPVLGLIRHKEAVGLGIGAHQARYRCRLRPGMGPVSTVGHPYARAANFL